ncbi:MAG TPA: hypothetical protein PK252_04425 [Bacteroidales bacterium]|nr:hypothetical protein [Bacteroidales bacterium]
MSAKTKISVGIIVVAFFCLGILFWQYFKPQKILLSPLNAVPENTAIVIKINGILPFLQHLQENDVYRAIKDERFKTEIAILSNKLDSIAHDISGGLSLFSDSSVYIAIEGLYNNKPKILVLFNISEKITISEIKGYGQDVFGNTFQKIDTALISNVSALDTSWGFYLKSGILVLGNNYHFLEASKKCLTGRHSLFSDTLFRQMANIAGKKVAANLFVQPKRCLKALKPYIAESIYNSLELMVADKGFTALDINIDNSFIAFQGFSKGTASNSLWPKILRAEEPVEAVDWRLLPEGVYNFSAFSMSDPYNYTISTNELYKAIGQWSENIRKLNDDLNNNLLKSFQQCIGSQVISMTVKSPGGQLNNYYIVKTNQEDATVRFLNIICKEEKDKPVKSDTSDVILIRKLKNPDIIKVLFDKKGDAGKYEIVCKYNDFLVFAESEYALYSYLDVLKVNKSILNDSVFVSGCKTLFSTQSNYITYFNLSKASEVFFENLTNKGIDVASRYLGLETGKATWGFQLSGNNEMSYCNGFIRNEVDVNPVSMKLWEVPVSAGVAEVYKMYNADSSICRIIAQDSLRNVYILSGKGDVLSKISCHSKMLGQPVFYKNKSKQDCIAFNSSDELYFVTFNGMLLENSPIKLRNNASAGIATADFDNNGNYRFYLPLENKDIVALDQKGKKVDGWAFKKTNGVVRLPILCFSYKNKDYLVVADDNKPLFLMRNGLERFKVNKAAKWENIAVMGVEKLGRYFKLYTQEKDGCLKSVFPDGHIEKLHCDSFSMFLNGQQIFFVKKDSLTIKLYNTNFKPLIDRALFNTVSSITDYTFSDNMGFIAAFDKLSGLVTLCDQQKVVSGFPVNAFSPFIFCTLKKHKPDNIIVVCENKKLAAYSVP